jgi:hypothetical protein
MAVRAADRQASSATVPRPAADNIHDLAAALSYDALGDGSCDLRSWRMKLTAFGIAGWAPVPLVNHIPDAAQERRMVRV